MTVEELPQYLMEHGQEVRERLLAGTYQPRAVLRREIPRAGRRNAAKLSAFRAFSTG